MDWLGDPEKFQLEATHISRELTGQDTQRREEAEQTHDILSMLHEGLQQADDVDRLQETNPPEAAHGSSHQ